LSGAASLTGSASLPQDPFFTPAAYIGAAGLDDSWYRGWTDFSND
jgi:hypothetical protein